MAEEVFDTREIKLQDGTEVELKPLVLKKLRRFMKAFRAFGEDVEIPEGADEETKRELEQDHEYEVFLVLAGICLEGALKKEKTEKAEGKEEADEMWAEWLEETLDMPTIFKIIEVGAGMKLDDPNLLAAAAASLQEQSRMEAGTN